MHDRAKIKRVVVATYQSVSGAGKDAMDELWTQTRGIFVNDEVVKERFTKQIAFNVIPHIDTFMEDGYTKEEWKMKAETKKILDPKIKLTATCVRVPVFVGHSEAVNIEFEEPSALKKRRKSCVKRRASCWSIAAKMAATSRRSNVSANSQPTCRASASIQRSRTASRSGACRDNLRKGAALNAVQIAELMLNRGLFKNKAN